MNLTELPQTSLSNPDHQLSSNCKMLAEAQVVSEAGGPFLWQQIEVDDNLRDDEALIEMKATGICHTDLNFRHEKTLPGLFPGVLGHEGR